jgi:hypothetical protein
MDTPLILALLAAIVTLAGWVINYILNGRDEQRRNQLQESLTYLEGQLQDLYGPLAFLIQAGQRTHQELLNSLGRERVFEEGKELSEDDLKTWLFWVENDVFPRNEKIKELLTNQTHLIAGGEVPQSYLDFMEHYNTWKVNHLRWQKEQVKYAWHSSKPYPDEFGQEVLDTFERIKAEHSKTLGLRHARAKDIVKAAEPPTPPTKNP